MALPDIIVAGAQKCGTTTLHRWLVDSAGISAPVSPDSHRPIKEVHFFTTNWDKGSPWYEDHFQSTRSLDTTPNYLSDTRAHSRMAAILPEAKVVVCLRDPIDRAYSQYNHYRQALPESASYDWLIADGDFHANISAELSAGIDDSVASFRGFIARGLYLPQISSLLSHFNADQVHVTIMEHWATQPDSVADLAKFLHVCTPSSLPVTHKRAYTVESLERRTVDALMDVFAPYNERLFEHLGFRITEWR